MNRLKMPRCTLPILGLLLVNLLVLNNFNSFHIAQLFVGTYVLLTPGLLFLSLFFRTKLPMALVISLAVPISLLFLMLVGLGVNTVLPLIGVDEPLRLRYLLPAFDLLLIVLYVIYRTQGASVPIRLAKFNLADWAIIGLGGLLPILAVMGAVSLNNGGTNFFSLILIVLVAIQVLVVVGLRHRLQQATFPLSLFAMALALLLTNSMRGWFITGHDVLLEFLVFRLTNTANQWDIAVYRDPYNACLSITILPTYLQRLLQIDPLYVYKIVFQFITACTAVNIFYICRTYATNIISYLSVFIFISFPTFLVDMPMLNRQGTAFLFFSALMVVLLTGKYTLGSRHRTLPILFGTGVILSHYSSSYVTIGVLVLAYLVNIIIRAVMNAERPALLEKITFYIKTRSVYEQPRQIRAGLILVLFLMLVIWTSVITRTSTNIMATLKSIGTSLIRPDDDDETRSGVARYGIIQGREATKQELFDTYVQESIDRNREPSNLSDFYPSSTTDKYQNVVTDEPLNPVNRLGKVFEAILPFRLSTVYNGIKQLYAKIIQVLLIIGIFAIVLGYRFSGNVVRYLPSDYVALSVGGVGLLAAQLILPQSAIDYGLLRLFQQNLIILALPICLGLLFVMNVATRNNSRRLQLMAGLLVGFFILLSGFVSQITGGGRPTLTLNNSGFYYDAYYTHATEVAGIEWLRTRTSREVPVQSDRYFSSTKMQAYSTIAPRSELIPQTIRQRSYVYLGHNNQDGQIIEYVSGEVVYYRFPIDFLDDQKDLIYSSSGSRIYR